MLRLYCDWCQCPFLGRVMTRWNSVKMRRQLRCTLQANGWGAYFPVWYLCWGKMGGVTCITNAVRHNKIIILEHYRCTGIWSLFGILFYKATFPKCIVNLLHAFKLYGWFPAMANNIWNFDSAPLNLTSFISDKLGQQIMPCWNTTNYRWLVSQFRVSWCCQWILNECFHLHLCFSGGVNVNVISSIPYEIFVNISVKNMSVGFVVPCSGWAYLK